MSACTVASIVLSVYPSVAMRVVAPHPENPLRTIKMSTSFFTDSNTYSFKFPVYIHTPDFGVASRYGIESGDWTFSKLSKNVEAMVTSKSCYPLLLQNLADSSLMRHCFIITSYIVRQTIRECRFRLNVDECVKY
jgi:hypothetical protein